MLVGCGGKRVTHSVNSFAMLRRYGICRLAVQRIKIRSTVASNERDNKSSAEHTSSRKPYDIHQRLNVLAELPNVLISHNVVARFGCLKLLDEAPIDVHELVLDVDTDLLLLGRASAQGVGTRVGQARG